MNHKTIRLLNNNRSLNLWLFLVLAFICVDANGQSMDAGYISMTFSGMNIRMPVENVFYNDQDHITVRGFCRITEPMKMTAILNLALLNFSADSGDLEIDRCWLSLEQRSDDGEEKYISFGFHEAFGFYSSRQDLKTEIRKLETKKAVLSITKMGKQDNRIIISGRFFSSLSDDRNIGATNIEIQNGHFSLFVGEIESLRTTVAQYAGTQNDAVQASIPENSVSLPTIENGLPSNSDNTLSPSTTEEVLPIDSPPPNLEETQPMFDNPILDEEPQQRTRYRSIDSGHGEEIVIPPKANRESSQRGQR